MNNFPKITTILSNKRTILAYLRTSLTLFSFGLAVNKIFIVNKNITFRVFTIINLLLSILILILGYYDYKSNLKNLGEKEESKYFYVFNFLAIIFIFITIIINI